MQHFNSAPNYRRGGAYAAKVRFYLRHLDRPEYQCRLDRYQLALLESIRQALTDREIQCLTEYYLRQRSMYQAAQQLGIHLSTMSRNVARAEEKLDRVLELADNISPIRVLQSA
ncbi:MAG: sigma-70 family RNA polymerase sigma factor [Oscillospiraceae bacterium]|nr:sigma-70 family RNA polymerase sigma factor [Oscillospiraceae bacterium]